MAKFRVRLESDLELTGHDGVHDVHFREVLEENQRHLRAADIVLPISDPEFLKLLAIDQEYDLEVTLTPANQSRPRLFMQSDREALKQYGNCR
jgi:hypothetical protein